MVRRFFKNLILRITSCVMVLVTLFSAGGCSLADVFAWMSDNGLSSPIDITSNVHKTYFNGGDGSEKNPYQIDNALQLYYFAWLQDLGLFNVDSDDEGTQIDTVYFVLTNNIDMSGYQLPPIGTTEHPFLGNFDGQGYTVSNLTVENEREHLFEPPEGSSEISKYTEIIGFFGVVGSINDKYKNEDGTYNYATQANKATNLVIEDITIITHTEHALVGFVAGYVNGTVDLVGVADGTVKVSTGTQALSCTTNISDYSIIGYCSPEYKKELYVFGASLNKPGVTKSYTVVLANSGEGEGQGWGGSVKMSDIYTWLSAIKNRNDITNNAYILERTDCVVDLGSKVTFTVDTDDPVSRKTHTINDFGAFVFEENSYVNYVNFVGGGQKVKAYVYAYSNEPADVYYIKDGDYYLNFDGNAITSQGNPTPWYRGIGDFAGAIYTVLNNRLYYLTIDGGRITTILDKNADFESLPEWDFADNKLTFNGAAIECDEGTWQIAASTGSYKISINYNGTTYYLDNNGTTAIQREANVNNAAVWTIETVNGGYTLSTVINDTTYYLGYNANTQRDLALSTTATTWQRDGDRIYVVRDNQNYYLRYSSGGGNFVCQNYSSTYVDLTFTAVAGAGTGDSTSNIEIQSATDEDKKDKKKVVYEEREYIDTSLTNGTYNANGQWTTTGSGTTTAGITYFPLSTTVSGSSYQINPNNTGYIVGAEWDTTTYQAQDNSATNLRISSYTSNVPSESEARNPYTISNKTKGSDGKYQFQKVNVQRSASESELNLTAEQAERLEELGLQKYAGCYDKYLDSVLDNSWEGLHFMDAPILESNLTTIKATLKNQPIDGYEVPTNSIDFHLFDKGLINVVAGSYYTQGDGNNSFFSIYQIERTGVNKEKILWIKEIYKIYAKLDENGEIDESEDYMYTYYGANRQEVDVNGKDIVVDTSKYEMLFDCDWITKSNDYSGWANSRAYYFEVPVNEGEYAIGSTKNRTGAYLVYLDLAANAQLLDRVKEYEEIVENKAQASIPTGRVDMLALEEGKEYTLDELKTILGNVDPFTSAFASITTDAGGGTPDNPSSITVTRTGNTIKFVTQNGGVRTEYIYVESALTVDGTLENVPITETTTIKRVTYRDKNKTTGDLTVTVLSEITVTKLENGQTTKTTTYLKEITVTDKNGNPVGDPTRKEITNLKEFVPDTVDPATGIESSQVGGKLIDIAFAYGTDVDLKISYSYLHEGLDEQNQPVGTYVILIENPGENLITLKAILTTAGLAAINSGIKIVITDGTKETTLNATTDAQMVEIAGTGSTEDPPAQPEEQPTE